MPPVAAGTRLRRGEDPVCRWFEDLDRPSAPEVPAYLFDLGLDFLPRQRAGDESDARVGAGDPLARRGES
ncbi:MAG TPA: hypothetical protein VFF17_07230 [Thermoanaerobaculia bacterium]|nr:hypothetical protein [Thermoanaerobaculia bacterium]